MCTCFRLCQNIYIILNNTHAYVYMFHLYNIKQCMYTQVHLFNIKQYMYALVHLYNIKQYIHASACKYND